MNKPVHPIREGFVHDEPVPDPPAGAPAPVKADDDDAAPFVETWPIKVRLLHRAIRNERGEELKELSFREPTGGDINRYGNPVRIDMNGEAIIDERKMYSMMAVLSGVLLPMLERMDPRDWNSCAYRLRGFFLPDFRAW